MLERAISKATPGSIEDIRNRKSNLVALNKLSKRLPVPVKDKRLTEYDILVGENVTFGDQIDYQDEREDVLRLKFRKLWLKATCAQIINLPCELQITIFQGIAGSESSIGPLPQSLEFLIFRDADLWRPDPLRYTAFDYECFDISPHGAIVAREVAREAARRPSHRKFGLNMDLTDLADFLGRDRCLDHSCISLGAASFIQYIEFEIHEDWLHHENEDNFRAQAFLGALRHLPPGRRVMIRLFLWRSRSECLNCGRYLCDGDSYAPHSRVASSLAHLYNGLRCFCESLEQILIAGVEIELSWSRYFTLYGRESPKNLRFCQAVKSVLDKHRAVSTDI